MRHRSGRRTRGIDTVIHFRTGSYEGRTCSYLCSCLCSYQADLLVFFARIFARGREGGFVIVLGSSPATGCGLRLAGLEVRLQRRPALKPITASERLLKNLVRKLRAPNMLCTAPGETCNTSRLAWGFGTFFDRLPWSRIWQGPASGFLASQPGLARLQPGHATLPENGCGGSAQSTRI